MTQPTADRLRPYVPRVVLRQLAEGDDALTSTVEGTVVFVDVSGFTRLSERLARRGREGAEHLVDAIGGCFSSLLALAYANGGSLLKFGGDALLLLFEGPGHVERGVRSAAGMRRTLRDVGRIEAGGAKVTLRMSVGVHTGDFHFFLVGGSHREFLVTGPGATCVVRMENAADAGEILLSPAVCERLPAGCVGALKGPGRLLARAPTGASLAPDVPSWTVDDDLVAGCLSTSLRAHVLAGAQAPEHRTVNVAFVHFDGTDALIERDGPAAATAALENLVGTVQAAADEYGVCFMASDVDADGGKLILTTGAPRVLGDDEERMLLALRRIVEADVALPIHVGVNRGPVFAGDVGPQYRRTYTVMGDATNLAARLMAKAPAGEIYASAGILERSTTRFELRELEPFTVKGKAEPVQAWAVGPVAGARSAASDAAPDDVPLVGREPELAAIELAIASAADGNGRLLEIVGEPGIGKSRLVEEIRARAARFARIEAPCEAYTSASPYATWRPILRRLAGATDAEGDGAVLGRLRAVAQHDPSLTTYLPLIAIAAGVQAPSTLEVDQLAAEFRQATLHDVVGRFLRLKADEPHLVEIEHAHHMDAASRDLLAAVVDVLEQSRWIVVVTRRDTDAGFEAPTSPSVVRLAPESLDPECTLELARCLTRRSPLPPHALRAAADRSGGNPGFLRDLLRAAADGVEELPDSIEAAAMARIDRLAPADRALVRRVSVLGLEFDRALLPEILGRDAPLPDRSTWERLERFLEHDAEGRVRFRRAVVRDAAYAGLPFRTRRELHALAGERLERELGPDGAEAAGVLSLHFQQAGDLARTYRYARMAADRAVANFAHGDAVALYMRAIEAARRMQVPDDELAEMWACVGEARTRTGETDGAIQALATARRLVRGQPVREAQLLHRQALVCMDARGIAPAVRYSLRGLRVLDGVAGSEAGRCEAQLVAALAMVRLRQGRGDDAVRLCHRAIALAEAVGDESALARACYVLDWAMVESGHSRETPYGQRALDLYRKLGDRYREAAVLNSLGATAYRDGRWQDAVDLWSKAADANAASGNLVDVAIATGNIGELLSDQGRLDAAEPLIRDALQTFEGSRYEWGVAYTTALLGRLTVRAGRHQDAGRLLADAIARFRELKAAQDGAWAEALLAEAWASAGLPEPALRSATSMLSHRDEVGRLAPMLHRIRGSALAQLSELDAAEQALGDAVAAARANEEQFEVALGLDALEALGRLTGETDPDRRRERDAIFDRLDVVVAPPFRVTAAELERAAVTAP